MMVSRLIFASAIMLCVGAAFSAGWALWPH